MSTLYMLCPCVAIDITVVGVCTGGVLRGNVKKVDVICVEVMNKVCVGSK